MSETIFSKIIRKEIPADIVFENEKVLAFSDIRPQAPIHVLIIPKIEIATVSELNGKLHAELLGEMIDAANKIAADKGIDEAYLGREKRPWRSAGLALDDGVHGLADELLEVAFLDGVLSQRSRPLLLGFRITEGDDGSSHRAPL